MMQKLINLFIFICPDHPDTYLLNDYWRKYSEKKWITTTKTTLSHQYCQVIFQKRDNNCFFFVNLQLFYSSTHPSLTIPVKKLIK